MDAVMRWNAAESSDCQYCPGVPEAMTHLVEECPACRCPVDLNGIHKTYPDLLYTLKLCTIYQ